MESIISGYAYDKHQGCSGRELGNETSLQSAKAKCDTNVECACIADLFCDGGYWYLYASQSTASDSDCSWSKQGSRIRKFEKRS